MKNLLNLSNTQQLSKKEQRTIKGGWDSGYCDRLFASGDCANPNWEACGLPNNIKYCR